MKKYTLLIIILVLAITFAGIFKLFNTTQKHTQLRMGTYVEITINAPLWTDFDKVFSDAFSAIERVEHLGSRYDESSALAIINQRAYSSPMQINNELFELIELAQTINKNTNGAFDVTVAPFMKLWGFYENTNNVPTDIEIKTTLAAVGYDNIILDKAKKTIFLRSKQTKIDLSAIAKGYAVDEAIAAIKLNGINSAIVNAGGDLYCLGKKNIFQNWIVGIRNPVDKTDIIKVVPIENLAVATSGGYEKFFTDNKKEFSHLIDPRTGMPAKIIRNATVIAKTCAIADALATALCILDEKYIKEIEKKYNVDVVVVK